jgi:hypothetical protein
LKGLEELLGRGDSVSAIDESHNQDVTIQRHLDDQLLAVLILHSALAIFCDIQERLQECLWLCGNHRQGLRHFPSNGDAGLMARRLDHDAQILENWVYVDALRLRLSGLLQLQPCHPAQAFHQRAERTKIFAAGKPLPLIGFTQGLGKPGDDG